MPCIEAAREPEGRTLRTFHSGMRVTRTSDACQMIGAAGNILVAVGQTVEPDPHMIDTMHATGEYLTSGSTFAGVSVRWFRDHVGSLRFG